MVFSLKKLLKKKRGGDSDDASTEIQRSNKGKFIRGGKLSKKKSLRSNDHHGNLNSPLGTIEEKDGGTNKTVRPTPPPHVMTSVNVVETVDGGTELVFGDIPIMANDAPSFEEDKENDDEPDLVGEEDEYEDPGGVHVDELKKQLFANDYDDDDDDIVEPAPAVVVEQDEIPPIPDEPFDEPFDEKDMKKEDPYIMELMQTDEEAEQILQQQKEELQQQQQKEQQKEEQHQLQREAIAKVHVEQQQKSPEGLGGVAQNFMEVFACNADTTMFYDTICAEPQIKKRKRPYFNEEFAIEFIREATEDGISMLYHVPPSNPVDNDWTGQSMNMYILTGDCSGDEMMHPKFMWMTASGGYSRLAESSDVVSFAVGVLDVHSIMDSMEDENGNENEEDLVFFSITTNGGDVHLFECPTEEERNRLVAGIKNVIARMSFSIVAGDDVVLSELYTGDGEDEGELPPLRTPDQDMAGVSYQFLDSVAPGIVPKRNPSARVAL